MTAFRRLLPLVFALGGCGDGGDDPPPPAHLPYATSVVRFEPGTGAGYGDDDFPDVVLGPPSGKGLTAGSLDVLSLGQAGSIELAFGDRVISDGDGPDFVVFENAFWPGGDSTAVFAELGEVSVSDDGDNWVAFACDPSGDAGGAFPGCAGWSPTLEYDASELVPLDPERSGGDAFDLADLGLATARFVRVTDRSSSGSAPSAGFDLDAVGVVHEAPAP